MLPRSLWPACSVVFSTPLPIKNNVTHIFPPPILPIFPPPPPPGYGCPSIFVCHTSLLLAPTCHCHRHISAHDCSIQDSHTARAIAVAHTYFSQQTTPPLPLPSTPPPHTHPHRSSAPTRPRVWPVALFSMRFFASPLFTYPPPAHQPVSRPYTIQPPLSTPFAVVSVFSEGNSARTLREDEQQTPPTTPDEHPSILVAPWNVADAVKCNACAT